MVLLKVDRASMYHSLEVRVPLLDREVVDLACRIDWRSCLDLNRNIGKLPLRHSLGRQLHFQAQTKRGFEVPMNTWLRGSLKEVFQESRNATEGNPGHANRSKKIAAHVPAAWGLSG